MLSITELRKNSLIQVEGEPFRVIEYHHTKQGRGGAIVKTKLKSLVSGNVLSKTFKGNEKVEAAEVEKRDLQFLYKTESTASLMDTENYEQYEVEKEVIGEGLNFLPEGAKIIGLIFNQKLVGAEIAPKIVLKVEHTEPAVRGDTAKAAQKPARLENGASINVPLFINTGDSVRVDTRNGAYIERA